MIKHTQECEAGLVYRSYCIDTTTVYAPYLFTFPACHQKWTTTTYPKPKSLPQTPRTRHHVNLPETAPSPSPPGFSGLPELRGACAPTSRMPMYRSLVRSRSVTVLFTKRAAAMACGSEGQRTRRSTGQVARRGVMGCTCSWKSPLNWLMSANRWVFGMIAPGFIQILIG